ncbi:MAG: inositol monophosphatase family protein [Oscillatoria sp. PMC 1068.18]|nr:inositol monophosphatase family protein [Oscillatoria sp. PMC 1076.18]MEC4990893.1 inositol monophosphatase family protein [Oscillatoria sp. PMC 1068.18]
MDKIEFWDEVLDFAEKITVRVGSQLVTEFGKRQATTKEDGSLVTQADQWADREITAAIANTFPTHGVISEETQHILPDTDWCWVIDPIDGTTNFSRGVPVWAISLGLLYQGTPVFGAVRLPQLGQFFYGYWYGDSGLNGPTGAYLNGNPIHTSPDSPTSNHLFNLCARSTSVLRNPFPFKIRAIGVATYSVILVATGASLGAVEATPKIWDIAAVWAILQAAGGVFAHIEPEPVFPLTIGENYGQRPFPSLAVSREEVVPVFMPLVEFLGEKAMGKQAKN